MRLSSFESGVNRGTHWQALTSPCPYGSHLRAVSAAFPEVTEARPWYTICPWKPQRRNSLPMNLEGAPLKCLGCGTVLRRGDAHGARTLCHECRCFAKLAPHGTRCPQCRSDDVVYTSERTGQETLFCAGCDYIWTRVPMPDIEASSLSTTRRSLWVGVERRHVASSGARTMSVEATRRRAS